MANPPRKTAKEVFEQVQQLDPDEREELSALLEQEKSHGWASPELEQAWLEEARRRSKLRAEGKTRAVPGEEFFAGLRRKYAE
jgi:hypothetical protein